MSMEFLGGINQYWNKSILGAENADGIRAVDSTDSDESHSTSERSSLLADALSFQRPRNERVLRPLAFFTLLTTAWLLFPRSVFAKKHEYKPVSQLTSRGLTQNTDAKLRKKLDAAAAAERAKHVQPKGDVVPLSLSEMQHIQGRGAKRNPAFSGTMPWQRSFHDVNLANGNLFKSFTDVQVAPGRGAGLALQRTYNSNDDRQGPFGTGWTHAYDIRMEEAGTVVENNVEKEIVPRTDFFGGKHKYVRDADGLYTPPAYLYDEMDSRYDDEMIDGFQRVLEDSQVDMSGTIKHFVPEGVDASGDPSKTRVCDYIQDRFGNRTTLTYGQTVSFSDGSTKNLLTEVKDPVNRTLTFTWQNLGTTAAPAWRITSVQSPLYTVTYEYYTNAIDTSSYLNLWKVHLDSTGLDRTTTYTYTTNEGETGLLSSIVDPLGNTVSYHYTYSEEYGTNWVTRVSEPSGVDENNVPRTTPFNVYILPGRVYSWSEGMIFTYFNLKPLYDYGTTDDPSGEPPFSFYVGQPFVVMDMNLRTVGSAATGYTAFNHATVYDANNNVVQQDAFDGTYADLTFLKYQSQVNATYGPHGNVLEQWMGGYPNDKTITTYYDGSKYFQKASVTDPMGHTSTFDYYDKNDPAVGNRGNVKWVRDAGYGVSTSPSYNKQFDYTYNQYGQKVSETNLNGVVTSYTYGDSWGNLTQVVQDPGTGKLNRTTSMVYNAVGNVTASTDPNGQTSTFLYNKLGQPTSASLPAKPASGTPAETLSYAYGANGRTNSMTDNRGTTSITYEAGSDRVSSVTDPVNGTIGYHYNIQGSHSSMTLPGGGTVTYQYYDGTNTDVPDGGYVESLPKDDPNSLNHPLRRIIDDQGRIVTVMYNEDNFNATGAKYSGLNHNWMEAPRGAQFNEVYDYANYPSKPLRSFTKTLDTWDNVTGGYQGHSFTKRLLIKRETRQYTVNPNPGKFTPYISTLIHKNEYTYDANGQRTTNTITTLNSSSQPVSRTETYIYDQLSRLKTVHYGDGQSQTYNFDAMGNRTSKLDNVTGNEGYVFDAANRLFLRSTGAGLASYTSDANGNTLTDGTRTNVWDSQNRLASVATSGTGGKTSTFDYGADGLRRKFTVTNNGASTASSITHYGYDGTNVVREWEEDPTSHVKTISATYLLGPMGAVYRRPATSVDVRWYVYDGLGSVVGEVDVNGTLMSEKKHDVYGLSRGVTGTSTSRHGFVGGLGHYSDEETGLVYMRARYYDPAIGRFISEDPAKDGVNWYGYCSNDPINKSDVTGKEESVLSRVLDFLAAIGVPVAKGTLGWYVATRIVRLIGLGKSVDAITKVMQDFANSRIKLGLINLEEAGAYDQLRKSTGTWMGSEAELAEFDLLKREVGSFSSGIANITLGWTIKIAATLIQSDFGSIKFNP